MKKSMLKIGGPREIMKIEAERLHIPLLRTKSGLSCVLVSSDLPEAFLKQVERLGCSSCCLAFTINNIIL